MPEWARARWLLGSARADLVLAVGLYAAVALEVLARGLQTVTVVSAAVCTLPLAARRRAPLFAALGVLTSVLLQSALGGSMESLDTGGFLLASLVAMYTVSARDAWPVAVLGALTVLLGVWLLVLWEGARSADNYAYATAILAVPLLAGRVVRGHRRRARQLSRMAARLEREREASARLAVAEERSRMTRELQDAIAHAVSVMVVQAAAAEAVMATAPARSARALRVVQETGRDAISELRRMLHMLRREDHGPRDETDAEEIALQPGRRRSRVAWSARLDALIALVSLALAEIAVLSEAAYDARQRLVSAVLMLAATLPLAIRRRFPLAVALTIVAAVALQQVIVDLEDADPSTALLVAPLVALYTVGVHCSGRRALVCACVSTLIAAAADTIILAAPSALDSFAWAVFVAIPTLSGRVVRLHRRQVEQLRTLTTRLEGERDARARLAVINERTRVARELHDAIAHGVSVMVLQAGAAELVLASDTAQATQAARAVEDTGRTVLDELRQLLGVLHSDEDDSPRRPRPSLDDLDALLAQVRHAGLPVDLRVHGERIALPAGLDVSAYRVIQEGLTNALKHAGPVPTAVSVRYQRDALTLEILNEGDRMPASRAHKAGHGLIGMRERVALFGGDLHAGPRSEGGYALRVRLPLEGDGA